MFFFKKKTTKRNLIFDLNRGLEVKCVNQVLNYFQRLAAAATFSCERGGLKAQRVRFSSVERSQVSTANSVNPTFLIPRRSSAVQLQYQRCLRIFQPCSFKSQRHHRPLLSLRSSASSGAVLVCLFWL